MLSVVAGRNGGGAYGDGTVVLLLLCFFFLCFCFFSVSSSISHGAGAVANDGKDGDSLLLAALLPTAKREAGEWLGWWSTFLLLLCVFFFCALFSSVSVFQCFLFSPLLSAFLSVTALLSFSKILPLFLFSLPLLFISRKRRCPLLCPIVVQGGNGLPYLCRVRWSAVFARHGVPLFYCHVGRVWLCGCWQGMVVCKWKGEKVSGKNIFKNLFLPCLCMRREEEAASCKFFFFKKMKSNKIWECPKNEL